MRIGFDRICQANNIPKCGSDLFGVAVGHLLRLPSPSLLKIMVPSELKFVSYTPPASFGTSEGSGSAPEPPKRARGRPKGSKNKPKDISSTQAVYAVASGGAQSDGTHLNELVEPLATTVCAHFPLRFKCIDDTPSRLCMLMHPSIPTPVLCKMMSIWRLHPPHELRVLHHLLAKMFPLLLQATLVVVGSLTEHVCS